MGLREFSKVNLLNDRHSAEGMMWRKVTGLRQPRLLGLAKY